MDGVVADFVKAALKVHNKQDPWHNNPKHHGSYDIDKIWNLTFTEFWTPINDDDNFWNALDKTEEADELMEFLEAL